MNNNLYTKITDYKIFGFKLFQKSEVYKELDYDESEIIRVNVRPDYYKAEFE